MALLSSNVLSLCMSPIVILSLQKAPEVISPPPNEKKGGTVDLCDSVQKEESEWFTISPNHTAHLCASGVLVAMETQVCCIRYQAQYLQLGGDVFNMVLIVCGVVLYSVKCVCSLSYVCGHMTVT